MKVRALVGTLGGAMVDLTGALIEREWSINDSDGGEIDVVNVLFLETTTPLVINVDDDLVIEDFDDVTVRKFAGIIASINDVTEGLGRRLSVVAQDWKIILERSTFTLARHNNTDYNFIQAAFADAGVTEIDTTTLVETGRTIEELAFRGATLRDLMDTLKDITGFVWDVDAFKKLVYRPEQRIEAPFFFSDHINASEIAGAEPYYDAQFIIELGAYKAIEVRGALRLSDDHTNTMTGDGSRTVFHIAEFTGTAGIELITEPPSRDFINAVDATLPDRVIIERNTGSEGTPAWTVQDVGIEPEPLVSHDVVYNPIASRVEWAVAPANFSNAWRISGRRRSPVAAIAVTPGVKRITKRVITEPSIQSIEQAEDLADAFLREVGNKERVTLRTNATGLQVATTVRLTNTLRGLSLKAYRVHQVVTALLGGEVEESRVTLGAGSHSFAHLLSELKRKAGRQDYSAQEGVVNIRRIEFLGDSGIHITIKAIESAERGPEYFFAAAEELANPSFDDDLASWTESITATGSTSHETGVDNRRAIQHSKGAVKLIMTDSSAAGEVVAREQEVTAAAAGVWSFSAWVKVEALSVAKAQLRIAWLDNVGAEISSEVDEVAVVADYALLSLENKTAPALTEDVRVTVRLISTAVDATGTCYFDECRAEKVAALIPWETLIIADEWKVAA